MDQPEHSITSQNSVWVSFPGQGFPPNDEGGESHFRFLERIPSLQVSLHSV